jgi:hypothetical protein
MSVARSYPLSVLRIGGVAVAVAALAVTCGCRQQPEPGEHEMLRGTVESLHPDVKQLNVRVEERRAGAPSEDSTILCLLTSGEIYINDKFSSFDDVAVGDTVNLVGARDAGAGTERFAVIVANITRPEPLPDPPDLDDDHTANSQPQENEP